MKTLQVLTPFMLASYTGVNSFIEKHFNHVHCKGGGKGGGGGGSSKEYERQLREQREAREKAEREAEELKRNQDATTAERNKRAKASYLTGGDGTGDDEFSTRKSYLGSGN